MASHPQEKVFFALYCSLENVENWQIDYSYEQLATLHYLRKISEDSIGAILKTRSDELIYNLFIGRALILGKLI